MPSKPSSADIKALRAPWVCPRAPAPVSPRFIGREQIQLEQEALHEPIPERPVSRRAALGNWAISWSLILALVLVGNRPVFAADSKLAAPSQTATPLIENTLPSEDLLKIEQALPAHAHAVPKKARRLLIFDRNVNYGGHGSIPYANTAFSLMGKKTGAFETTISRDPAVFAPENLGAYDAVFLNNNVGNLFEEPRLRQSLIEFVYGGGGLLGVHGTTVAFTKWPGAVEDWPEFGRMLGARGANHRENQERVFVKIDDPGHPLTRMFNRSGFEYRDEFFRVHDPYSRSRVRVLLSIDTNKTDLNQGRYFGQVERADNDYALAWIRQYGRGRAFYCTIAHNPYVFWDPKMLDFYLAAVQFALGDLNAPATPSQRLTPSVRAQETRNWCLGLLGTSSRPEPLSIAIDRAAQLGLSCLGARYHQPINTDTPQTFDASLSPEQRAQLRLQLDASGVRLFSLEADPAPNTTREQRQLFAFAKTMGIETLIVDLSADAATQLEPLAREFDIGVAFSASQQTPDKSLPKALANICRGRTPWIGVVAKIDVWAQNGIKPKTALRRLQDRIRIVQFDVPEASSIQAQSQTTQNIEDTVATVLKSLQSNNAQPIMIGLGIGADPTAISAGKNKIEIINRGTLDLGGAQ